MVFLCVPTPMGAGGVADLAAAKDLGTLVVLTEWPQFRELDWARMAGPARTPVVVDTRNLLDPDVLRRAGVRWVGIGKGEPAPVG